jgi:hypothetical protein
MASGPAGTRPSPRGPAEGMTGARAQAERGWLSQQGQAERVWLSQPPASWWPTTGECNVWAAWAIQSHAQHKGGPTLHGARTDADERCSAWRAAGGQLTCSTSLPAQCMHVAGSSPEALQAAPAAAGCQRGRRAGSCPCTRCLGWCSNRTQCRWWDHLPCRSAPLGPAGSAAGPWVVWGRLPCRSAPPGTAGSAAEPWAQAAAATEGP